MADRQARSEFTAIADGCIEEGWSVRTEGNMMPEGCLQRLKRAMAGADPTLRDEVLAGGRESLHGLDDADVPGRIRRLGSPEDLARQALPDAPAASAARRGRLMTTVLAVALSALVFPLVWLASVVLLWRNQLWTRSQKWAGTILGIGVGAIAGAVSAALLAGTLGVAAGHPLVVWNSIGISLLAMTIASVIMAIHLARAARATSGVAALRR
ncbi:hypothetical protein [Microbacterium rhizomatis]|uniref:Uncharacterized protein n=1 Tax=Microbacterium rhizomatis TaxID=1631477 RepID=A0A5J5J976_9MICO|nr:hypothetical protein [Microbacterium rhizomatis]KAA9111338.1 hypothetical protein F6B43_07060 [Microbacterium rhizomatis]